MARRLPAPRHEPRVILASAACPEIWSERDKAGGVVVHAPGVRLRAPAACPSAELRKTAERLRGTYLALLTRHDGTADDADLDVLLAAAFGDQPLHGLRDDGKLLVCLSHVLRHWGLTTWS
jgi:hypothetical protein